MFKKYLVNKDFTNCRLDKWFKKNICKIPQSLLEKNIRIGKIKVNNKKERSSYKLSTNDVVILYNFEPSKENKKIIDKYNPSKKEVTELSRIVVEDNNDFLVINKPAGIAVQSGTKSKKNILDIFKKTSYFKNSLPYSVHRIDKDTTGLLIIAKNREYAQLFTSLFRIKKINKTYLGIVIGEIENREGTFIDYLNRYEGKKIKKEKAITRFKVIDSNHKYSYLKLFPETGRKHQLRKQLLIRGHPILGDSKYRNANVKKNRNNFLMLHSYKINFTINKKKYNYVAEPNFTFRKSLKEKYLKNF